MRAEDRSEICVRNDNGDKIPLGLSLSVIKGDSSSLRGVIAVFQDLTEAKRLEERMRTSDRLAAIGELAAGIAHEIRNPLASISGSVEVLKDELRPDGENLRLMRLILKESSRLNTILSDFLNFARVDKGEPGRCDLGVVIPEVVDLARGHDEIGDSVEISYVIHKPVLMINGGEDELRQILWNLILNSARALSGTGGIIRVHTEDYIDDKSGDMIKLVVSDNGPGISPGIKHKIFDPFFSTRQGGTGLGLPIVVRIVDRLGGRTELETSEGAGASFSIYIPRQVFKDKSIVPQEVI
jgi:two-component system sensor histidine kinase PilS (NtrC family)